MDLVEQIRKTKRGKEIYAMRKENDRACVLGTQGKSTLMRYTQHRGLARVTNGEAKNMLLLNLKMLATWAWNSPCFSRFWLVFARYTQKEPSLS
jgi:hypothetical protein